MQDITLSKTSFNVQVYLPSFPIKKPPKSAENLLREKSFQVCKSNCGAGNVILGPAKKHQDLRLS